MEPGVEAFRVAEPGSPPGSGPGLPGRHPSPRSGSTRGRATPPCRALLSTAPRALRRRHDRRPCARTTSSRCTVASSTRARRSVALRGMAAAPFVQVPGFSASFGAPRPAAGRPSATIPRDVRTNRAAGRAARDLRPVARRALGLDRRVRPRRLAPRDGRPGRRRPLHGAPHLQGHRRPIPSTRAISEAIEGVGGSFNAATDRESTVYWVRVPRREAERGDGRPRRADRPAARSTTRDRPRADRSSSRRSASYLDDPAEYAQILFQQAMFGDGRARPRDLRRRGRDPRAARRRRSAPSGGDVPAGERGRRGGRRPRP